MDDKELVEVWRAEFNTLRNSLPSFRESEYDPMFQGFLMAKRSQPSVVIDKKYCYEGDAQYSIDDIDKLLTAAGIKYTIGE